MSSHELHRAKVDMYRSTRPYRRFNKILNVFRTIQFLSAAVFLCWLISRFSPNSIFRFFSASFRSVSTLLLNHHFVFLLGNAIILTLCIKLGRSDSTNQTKPLLRQAAEIEPNPVDLSVARREPEAKRCRRSRSHEFDRERKNAIQLQRSETEPRRKMEESATEEAVDDLSNEEFQRKVEAFIARQQKFLREEYLSVVTAAEAEAIESSSPE